VVNAIKAYHSIGGQMKIDTRCLTCDHTFPEGELKLNNGEWTCPKCHSPIIEKIFEPVTKRGPFKRNKHGLKGHSIYNLWKSIKGRIRNPIGKNKCYKNVTMCNEWWNDPVAFYNWAINNGYKKGLMMDRIDNSKGYSPDNCRFVSMHHQAHNRHRTNQHNKSPSKYIGVRNNHGRQQANITIKNKFITIGNFDTEFEAAMARDRYIIKNNIDAPLQVLSKSGHFIYDKVKVSYKEGL